MAADGIGREEVGCCPLHAQAVAGIGVVGKPEFLVKGGGADIEPAAAGRAALEGDAREFLPQAAHGGVIVRDVVEEEVAPDGTLAKAYSAVWQEYEREGLVPHVEAVENGQFKITEQQTDGTTMELVLNAEDADAYLQSAIDKADAKRVAATQARLGADQDAEIIDLREEISNAASVIAGTAALRQVEQTGEQHGLQIEDVTAGLPDEIATPIRNQGYVSLKDAQNISEYAMGVIQGLTQEGMNETDARMSKNEAAGMVRSWGYWADFAQNFAHREAMAGLAPGEGRSSISRTRGEHKVQIDGREVYGSSLMGVKGAVTHYGALEDVTESVFDMMVQKRAQVILENQAAYVKPPENSEKAPPWNARKPRNRPGRNWGT